MRPGAAARHDLRKLQKLTHKTMNGKQAKKIRQIARRDYGQRIEELARINGRIIKPKPRWFPGWLWIKLLGIFIYIKK